MSLQQRWKCGIVVVQREARWSVIKQNYNKHSGLLINLEAFQSRFICNRVEINYTKRNCFISAYNILFPIPRKSENFHEPTTQRIYGIS